MVSDVRRLASYAWTHKITLGAHAPRNSVPQIPAIRRLSSLVMPQNIYSSPAAMPQESSPDESSSDDPKSEDECPLSTSEDDFSAASAATVTNRARRKRLRFSTNQCAPTLEAGAIPQPVQNEFTFFFPSRLRQQLLLSSPLFKRPRHSTASHMNTLAVLMPQNRTYCEFVLVQ